MSTHELGERELCAALRNGDELAFTRLVERYHAPLRRLALSYVRTAAVADEVVQDTWLAVIRGIDSFEGRSTLKTWIFSILANIAKTRGERESRTIPLSALTGAGVGDDEPAVDPDRFLDQQHARWPGHWSRPPARWDEIPEEHLAGRETLDALKACIDRLPPAQRQVLVLRDIEGWEPGEVCEVLGLTDANQRVLLHRARSKARRALEEALAEPTAVGAA
jgi:RNA polymerase sigma-70 factor (ECF subfamily)